MRERDGDRSAPMVHWGLVPVRAKDFKKQRPQPINARIETVASSPMFRTAGGSVYVDTVTTADFELIPAHA